MSLKALSDYTFVSRYANYRNDLRRRENYHEATDRVKNMHLEKYPQLSEEINWAFEKVHNKIALGSQRALQFGGKPIINKNSRLYNCISTYIDRARVFQETFWLLLCGCGTGFSVQKHHVNKLPEFHNGLNKSSDLSETPNWEIEDSIEGWADALGVLIACYMPHPEFPFFYGKKVKFDFTKIRPKGSPLGSGVGKAPGPDGLKLALEKIRGLLNACLDAGRRKLRPIDAYDIVMHASDAVLSGGIRRSASLAIFSLDDQEMLNAKTGDWYYTNPQRARSNNSALLLRNETGLETYHKLFDSTRQFGEPGMIWASNTEALYNPCFHRDTRILTSKGYRKIYDLYKDGENVEVITDKRVGMGDKIDLESSGVFLCRSSSVRLTQESAKIYEVVTEHGHILRVTDNHEFPTTRGRLKLKNMVIGDTILLQSEEGKFGNFGTYNQGLLLGLITGDGCVCNDQAFIDLWGQDLENCDLIQEMVQHEINQLKSISNGNRNYEDLKWLNQVSNVEKKRIGGKRLFRFLKEVLQIENPKSIKDILPEIVWQGSRDFVVGYIQGFLATDGSVQMTGNGKKSTLSIRLTQSNKKLLQEIQSVLNNFGIVSRIYSRRKEGLYSLPNGKGGNQDYFCNEVFELIISRPNCISLESKIGLFGPKKKLLEQCLNVRGRDCNKPERHITQIKSISYWGVDDVFCLNQPETNTVIANGCVVGQCVEIGLYGYNKDLVSGWQACNLSTINGSKLQTKEDFAVAAKVAAIIGTLQAGYTEFAYLGPVSEEIIRREALLGVSITGIMDHPSITLNPSNLKEMAQLVLETNSDIAAKIGINEASRTTCVKPEGSASCLLGTSSGIHPAHAKRYIRRTQANNMEAPVQHYKIYNPLAVEKSVWSSTGTDDVINFLIEMPPDVVTKDNITAVQFLETVKLVQENWVETGKRPEKCIQPWLSHNVSNTITVQPNEWKEVEDFIYENKDTFAGISLLGGSGDLDFNQAPFSKVLTEEEIVSKYGDKLSEGRRLVDEASSIFGNNLWKVCDIILGMISLENEEVESKKEWIEKTKLISKELFGDDIKSFTYMLKEIDNLNLWNTLSKEHREVNWELLYEEDDNTEILQSVACAGGKCNFS
jgi:hypothetical protein